MIGTVISAGSKYYQYVGENKFQPIFDYYSPDRKYKGDPVPVDSASRTIELNKSFGVFPTIKFLDDSGILCPNQDLSFLIGEKRNA